MSSLLHRALAAFGGPPLRWLLRRLGPPADAWEPVSVQPPLREFGTGLQYDFPAYLAGPSSVSVTSLDEIQDWLVGCAYQSDDAQFGRDHWQHPEEFERCRAGDCDDHAIWAWRKLIEIGVDATLVAGWCLPITRPLSRHAWVVFRDASGEEYLFETVARTKAAMLLPMSSARDHYRPEYGVDRTGRRFSYAGALLTLRERQGIDPLPPEGRATRATSAP